MPRFRLFRDREMDALPPLRWLVEGLILAGSLTILAGAPESYKTFVALDLALSVASGLPWLERPTEAGHAVYVSAEGPLQERRRAWLVAHDVAGVDAAFYCYDGVQLHQSDDVSAFLQALSDAEAHPQLIVIDTLARCITGVDENDAGQMGAAVAGLDRLRQATGAAVVVVHHTTRGTQRARGSSALPGAADAELALTRAEQDDTALLTVTKMRHAAHPEALTLAPTRVAWQDGAQERSSLVLALAGSLPNVRQADDLALHVLRQHPEGLIATAWLDAAGKLGLGAQPFHRARRRLLAAGTVQKEPEGRAVRYTICETFS